MDPSEVSSPSFEGAAVTAPGDSFIRICLVMLSGQYYAFPLESVREVFPLQGLTPVPGMPALFKGVTNVRGTIVPLVDACVLLGIPSNAPSARYGIILQEGEHQVSLLLDETPEIRSVRLDQFLPIPERTGNRRRSFLAEVLRLEERDCDVVDVPVLLACMDTDGIMVEAEEGSGCLPG